MLGIDRQRGRREGLSLEQIRAFLEASAEVGFQGRNRQELYSWINRDFASSNATRIESRETGLVRRYLGKMTGMSRAQVTRLIGQYLQGEEVKPKPIGGTVFPSAIRGRISSYWQP